MILHWIGVPGSFPAAAPSTFRPPKGAHTAMLNPADWLKKGVSTLHGWLEKAEREEMEQRLDIVKELEDPRKDTTEPGSLEALGEPIVDPSAPAPAAPAPAPAPEPAVAHRPRPEKQTPQPIPQTGPPQFASSSYPPPTRGIAGLAKREAGQQVDDQKIVINDTNDTMYRQRDMLVTAIRERYAGYGPRVATAVLQRALLPNGVEIILAKLGLKTRGNADRDHDQIIDFLNTRGVDPFCEALGIKADPAASATGGALPARGSAYRTTSLESSGAKSGTAGKSGTGGHSPHGADSTGPREAELRRLNAQHSQNSVEKGASHSMKMQKVNVKPIHIGAGASVPQTPMPPTPTPPPTPPAPASNTAPKPSAAPPASTPTSPAAAKPTTFPPTPMPLPDASRGTSDKPRAAFPTWKPSYAAKIVDTDKSGVDPAPPAAPPAAPPSPQKGAADFLAQEMEDSDRFRKSS